MTRLGCARATITLLQAAALASPLAVGALAPGLLPRGAAFVLAHGAWLVLAGLAATALAVAYRSVRGSGPRAWEPASRWL
ncbi:MAG TPA: hypothetical protein VLI67_01605, partial [Vicinamibacteria bacterium]|nr:hypothetical protein [Vicinamibacteria bacterium]